MNQGERIAHYRRRNGMSQNELAGKLGKRQADISRWENNGAEPKMSEVRSLAEALKVNPLLLLGYEDKDTSWTAGYNTGREETAIEVRAALERRQVFNHG